MGVLGHGGGQAEPSELVAALERRRPEMRPVPHHRAAKGVDRHEGGDPERRPRNGGRGRAETALQAGRAGAGAGSGRTQGIDVARCLGGLPPEVAIGRVGAPVLVATVEQIEQDRGGHDRHAHPPHGEATPPAREPTRHPGGGVQAEGRAAGQDQRVDRLHRALWIEQIRLAGPRPTAAHIDRGHRRAIEQDGGDPTAHAEVGGVPDLDAGNVGEKTTQAGFAHPTKLPRSGAGGNRAGIGRAHFP